MAISFLRFYFWNGPHWQILVKYILAEDGFAAKITYKGRWVSIAIKSHIVNKLDNNTEDSIILLAPSHSPAKIKECQGTL